MDYKDELAKFIFTSKYARYIPEKNRRETWEEACDRVLNMHLNKFKDLDKEYLEEIKWAFDMVKEKNVIPSMRSMQFAGKAIEAHNSRIFNCLAEETSFVTIKGVKSFKDLKDGDEIQVLSHKGIWRKAKVKCYGNDKLNRIIIRKGGNKKYLYATSDHRWLTKKGEFIEKLKQGDILAGSKNIFSDFNYDNSPPDERLYWCYGFVYGDGTKCKNEKGEYKYSMVRLCDNDIKYEYRFKEMGFKSSSPLSCKGDAIAYTGKYLKTAPNPEIDEPRLIRAFVRGYLDADGEKSDRKSDNLFLTIQSSDLEHINFIRKCFPIAGVFIISETDLTGQETNWGGREYTISFRVSNYFSPNSSFVPGSHFQVEEISETNRYEKVWCLEVEEDHSFVLENGLITGNCSARHIDSIRAFAEVFYLLLCGTGVGIGLSKFFLGRLSDLVKAEDKTGSVITYVIEDNIEGWADSIEALLSCYFRNTAYTGRKIIFDYCLAPGTRILKNDLTWSPVEKLKEGDKIIAFDENLSINHRRQIKEAIIEKTNSLMRPCYEIITDKGTVIASKEHKWLATSKKQNGKYKKYKWKTSDDLSIGDMIAFTTQPWDFNNKEINYMAGLLDGEGWVSNGVVGAGQSKGIILEKIKEIWKKYNIAYEISDGGSEKVDQIRAKNKWEGMKIIGMFRPFRLIKKSRELWEGRSVGTKGENPAKIIKINFLGKRKVIATQTTTHTLIAEGFLSHNSKVRPEGAPLKTSGGKAPGYKGLKKAHDKIKELLDYIIEEKGQRRLKPIDAYDILMHASDAVLSGGIRRSACIVIFDKDDEEMINAKTYFEVDKIYRFSLDEETNLYHGKVKINGKKYEVDVDEESYKDIKENNRISWIHIEPQRARSNNSVLLLRREITKKEFEKIIGKTKEFGEPGFVFANHSWQLQNPCLSGDTLVAVADGRNAIPIKKLFEENKIFPLYSARYFRKHWKVEIKLAKAFYRGKKEIIKLKLSNGDILECTEDHLIALKNGNYVVAKECKNKKIANFFTSKGHDSKKYRYINSFSNGYSKQHKMMWEFFNGKIPIGYVINHKSNKRGDFLENFQILKKKDHDKKTGLEMSKENNPIFKLKNKELYYKKRSNSQTGINNSNSCGLTDLELINIGKEIIKKGKKLTKNNLLLEEPKFPKHFSKNRFKGSFSLYKNIVMNKSKYEPPKLHDISEEPKIKLNNKEIYVIDIEYTKKKIDVFDLSVEKNNNFYIITSGDFNFGNSKGILVHNCSEISFINVTEDGVCGVQYCNLTSINGVKVKTKEDFIQASKAAAIIGTLQATYTDFPYLRPATKQLTEEEALLGVSITGIMDNPKILLNPDYQQEAAHKVLVTNRKWSRRLGINEAARVTCIKPEGSSSLVLGSASGIHPHHSKKYFRRVQNNKLDNVFQFFKKHNPHMCEESIWCANKTDEVITFPIEVDEKAITKKDLPALKHLKIIKETQENWVMAGTSSVNKKPITHNISCTVIVKENEWEKIINYVYKNKDFFGAVAFIPYTGDKDYQQAPLEVISTKEDEEKWNKIIEKFISVDYTKMIEKEDGTMLQQEPVCAGGICDISYTIKK